MFFFKKKQVDIPPAPLSEGELPEFPSLDELENTGEEVKVDNSINTIQKSTKDNISSKNKNISNNIESEEQDSNSMPLKRQVVSEGPVFINAHEYKDILDDLNHSLAKLEESENIIAEINEIKNSQDSRFEKWRNDLEDIERKLLYVDKTLFERGE